MGIECVMACTEIQVYCYGCSYIRVILLLLLLATAFFVEDSTEIFRYIFLVNSFLMSIASCDGKIIWMSLE